MAKHLEEQEDKQFYKFRILELFDTMIQNQNPPPDIPNVLVSTFEMFVQKCIQHFQLIDRNDYIQQEFIEDISEKDKSTLPLSLSSSSCEVSFEALNKHLYMTSGGKFKKKRVQQDFSVLFPKERNYDLKDPSLQHKKNIYLKYEKDNNNEETTAKNEIITMQPKT